jgi:hypothetical protein
MKKIKQKIKELKNYLLIINFLLLILLITLFGLQYKIPPFNKLWFKVLKPIIKPLQIDERQNIGLVKIDNEVEKKINTFWKKTESSENKVGNQVDYSGGIDWMRHIYWAEQIKNGGYILMFRHGEREKWHEALGGFDAYELYSKKNARKTSWYRATCLTERGIETSKNTGRAIRHSKIKIQKVISSPSCRARETAFYTFGRIDEIHSSLLHRTGIHPLDSYKFGMDLRKTLLNFSLDKDKNLILSAHNSVIDFPDLIDEFNIPIELEEGGFYIIEKVKQKLIVRYKFYNSSEFNLISYRNEPLQKKCIEPKKPEINCESM